MGIESETVITALWKAAEEFPADRLPPSILLQLMAAVCERLHETSPSEELLEESRELREAAKLHEAVFQGEDVRLGYAYSSSGDGLVALKTYAVMATVAPEEYDGGSVVGRAGVEIVFDEQEAFRAIKILGTMFPRARERANATPG